MALIRKQLYAREGAPPNTRTNPETGVVETSMDDGATWVPDPNSDPRQNPAYRLPPPAAPDVRCAAAAGMVEDIRRVLEAGALGLGAGGLATVLITLLLIPGIGWMFAAMLLFAGSITLAIAAGTVAEFTEDVYEQLLCIFYDNIGEDGSVTAEQLEAIHDQVVTDIGEVLVSDFVQLVFNMHGPTGLTNAGSAYADPDADCFCPGWCYLDDFSTDGGYTGYVDGCFGTMTIHTSGQWEDNGSRFCAAVPATARTCAISAVDLPAGNYKRIIVRGYVEYGVNDLGANGASLVINGVTVASGMPTPGDFQMQWDGDFTGAIDVGININCAFDNGTTPVAGRGIVYEVEYSGDGENPFGDDNC